MTPEQLAALAAALGLATTATAAEIVAKARIVADDALAPVAKALGLATTARPDEIVARAKVAAPNPGEFVPRAEFDRVSTRLNTLETERTDERATAAVNVAVWSPRLSRVPVRITRCAPGEDIRRGAVPLSTGAWLDMLSWTMRSPSRGRIQIAAPDSRASVRRPATLTFCVSG